LVVTIAYINSYQR